MTNKIQFTPKNRKTPIAFDARRHIIVKKTPDMDDVISKEVKEEPVEPASQSDQESDFEEEENKKSNNKKTKAAKSKTKNTKEAKNLKRKAPQSYREMSDDDQEGKVAKAKMESPSDEHWDYNNIANDDWRSFGAMDY